MARFLFSYFVILFLAGCSLYESGGRTAIEKNQGGILTSGLNTTVGYYFECNQDVLAPEFLKEPLEVVETPLESQNISVLQSQAPEKWLALYHHENLTGLYTYCKLFALAGNGFSSRDAVIRSGHQLLTDLLK